MVQKKGNYIMELTPEEFLVIDRMREKKHGQTIAHMGIIDMMELIETIKDTFQTIESLTYELCDSEDEHDEFLGELKSEYDYISNLYHNAL